MPDYQARLDRLEAQLGDDVPRVIVVKVDNTVSEAEREAAVEAELAKHGLTRALAERRRVTVIRLSFVEARP